MRKTIIVQLSIVVAALVVAGGLYIWQNGQAGGLERGKLALQKQVVDLEAQYTDAQVAGTIKTDSWKQYCDPITSLCFKYPSEWKFEGGDVGEWDRVGAILTNPEKTVTIVYDSPLVKDGGLGSAHIVQVSDKDVVGSKIKIIGSYPVSSGVYQPGYYMLNSGQLTDGLVPGEVGFGVINARFDAGKHDAIRLAGNYSGTPFATSAQAEAWFDSIEGRTVKAVLASFGAK